MQGFQKKALTENALRVLDAAISPRMTTEYHRIRPTSCSGESPMLLRFLTKTTALPTSRSSRIPKCFSG